MALILIVPSSASQQAIGTGVIGGMLSATLAIVFVPVFFVVVMRLAGRGRATNHAMGEERGL